MRLFRFFAFPFTGARALSVLSLMLLVLLVVVKRELANFFCGIVDIILTL